VRDYELIFVTKPDLTDSDIATVTTEVKGYIDKLGGTIEKEDLWGKKQLSYEIKDYTEGVYTYILTKLPPDAPGKLKDLIKIDERIIRYMVTVKVPRKPIKPIKKRSQVPQQQQ